ncbi:nuclear transport factor 2 family protein [Asanoa sp. WMMD1127]|uniref:nuclear transport factor 2 family protein n=1 Tax=Asanoa sp. WMMD1127 TaxID=3016107 RepID=UPI002415CE84|nr:nuclear transport factor 2 family protein [Asanoa sp. WMMD1127]MDG4825407.1 nuclear transport factor 2 family protein [Asanoa sp. WMMD1127]
MTEQPPAAISALIDATNAGDTDAFVAAFTDDAYIRDGSREFTGHDGVRSWDSTDNIGVGMHFDLLGWRSTGADTWVVTIRATSRRFNGTGDLHLTVRGDRIARLET